MADDDPAAVRSAFAVRAFSLYLRWYFKRHFHAVRVARSGLPADTPARPLIICSNHPSWWDPAMFVLLLDTLLPGRIGYGPMDSIALGHYGVLRRIGVFGIDPDTHRGAERFLRLGTRLLQEPRTALFITAEGAFADSRQRPIVLRSGIAHLARRVPQAVIVPLALEYSFWNERSPEALAFFGRPIALDAGASVAEWLTALQAGLTQTADELLRLSMRRDLTAFHQLLRGGTGVGGLYDLWRGASARLRGERFNPDHAALMRLPRKPFPTEPRV